MTTPMLPPPLVPADTDVRDLDGFMLNVERMLASELWALASAEEFRAAFALWLRAWKQTPAASLPDDERILAAFSGTGQRWKAVREMALRGFVKCSDGRLYHRVLAAEAMNAYTRKSTFQRKRKQDMERLRKWRQERCRSGDDTPHETRFTADDETRFTADDETHFVAEGQGQGQGQGHYKKRPYQERSNLSDRGSGSGGGCGEEPAATYDGEVCE